MPSEMVVLSHHGRVPLTVELLVMLGKMRASPRVGSMVTSWFVYAPTGMLV